MAGFFITFEGIDKSGKTTQARLLVERLRAEGFEVLLTREPGGTDLGREIRRSLLRQPADSEVSASAEMLLFAADRAQHVAEVIRPGLAAGKVVVSDRFVDSTLAYQGYGRGCDQAELRAVQKIAAGGLRPDLTVLVDVDVATARERSGNASPDRLEGGSDSFFERVRSGYLAQWEAEPERVCRVDGHLPAKDLAGLIYAEARPRIEA